MVHRFEYIRHFQCNSWKENIGILINISLNFEPRGTVDDGSLLV